MKKLREVFAGWRHGVAVQTGGDAGEWIRENLNPMLFSLLDTAAVRHGEQEVDRIELELRGLRSGEEVLNLVVGVGVEIARGGPGRHPSEVVSPDDLGRPHYRIPDPE